MHSPIGDYETVDLEGKDGLEKVGSILKDYGDDGSVGYFIEVDFMIPPELHDKFDYAPVAKRTVSPDELSEHQRGIGELLGACTPSEKLVPYLGEHKKVLYHAGLLKFWVEQGCVITKVYNVWSFTQSKWMAEYILGMARRRAVSKDPVERECIKKAMNSLYGKMLQDKSTQRNLVPYTGAKNFVRACSRESCVNFTVEQFDGDGVGFFGLIETSKKNGPLLDMPRAAGFGILDNSKLIMLRCHYGFFKERYQSRAVTLFTDTDSLGYKVYCRCIMDEMLSSVLIDFDLKSALSPYDIERFSEGDPHKKALLLQDLEDKSGKLGAMKLENGTNIISEFCGGLRLRCTRSRWSLTPTATARSRRAT